MAEIMWMDIGDEARMTASFYDKVAREYVDPASVVCTVRTPKGANVTPTPTHQLDANEEPIVGHYEALVEVTESGNWYFAFDGSAPKKGAGEGEWKVRVRKVPR